MNNSKPNFLGIGAQKSATRWLYNQLLQHPDLYLPPVKELHYFDKLRSLDSYRSRFKTRAWNKSFNKLFKRPNVNDIAWKVKYCFGRYSDDWYQGLFNKADGRKAGEVTPEYSILPESTVKDINAINPDLRIIYLLRDPVSRAWSHFRMHVNRSNLDFSEMSEKEVLKFIGSKNCFEKGNYHTNLKRWLSVFEEEQIFVGYLDEVKSEPIDLLNRVTNHIGAETPSNFQYELAEEPSHVGVKIPMDKMYEDFLREQYYHHNEDLYGLLGNPIVKSWNA